MSVLQQFRQAVRNIPDEMLDEWIRQWERSVQIIQQSELDFSEPLLLLEAQLAYLRAEKTMRTVENL